SGLSHLLGRVMQSGSDLRAETGSDHLTLAAAAPAARLDEELDELAARMGALEISDDDLDRERPALLEELARLRGGDATLAAMSFAAEAIRPSRGGWRGGVPKEIEQVTAEEAQAFYDQHLKP